MTVGDAATEGGQAAPPGGRLSLRRRVLLPLFVCASILLLDGIDISLRHAWISLKWPQADAVILTVAEPGPRSRGWRSRNGYPYAVAVIVQETDGREFAGQVVEPLFSLRHSLEAVPAKARDRPPRPGDRIRVHLHPSGDGRVMPRDNLRTRGGTIVIHAFVIVFTLLTIAFPVLGQRGRWRG